MKGERADPDPLLVRRLALRILRRVGAGGAWASVLLDRHESVLSDPRDARLLHEIVLGTLRRRAALDHAIANAAERSSGAIDPPVLDLLRVGAYGILFLERVPDFAAVDTAVRLVRESGKRRAAGFVNAVLRRIARDREGLLPPPARPDDAGSLALATSHPDWWVSRVVARLGWDAARALLEADGRPAPTVLRASRRHGGIEAAESRLEGEGIVVRRGSFVDGALHVVRGAPARSSTVRAGAVWVADEAAQMAAALLSAGDVRRVVDLCAAPGGKTLQIDDALADDGFVVAVDRHAGRLRRLAANVRRVGAATVRIVRADATRPLPLTGTFDGVLLDAPCTGTGTMRRRPEIRWRIAPDDPARLGERQRRMLGHAAGLVAPGGALVYSVCSMEPEEGEGVIGPFLEGNPDFEVDDPRPLLGPRASAFVGEDGALRTRPDLGEVDGFYAVRMRRRPGRGTAR